MKTKSTLAVLTAFLITGIAHGATGFFGGLYFVTSLNNGTNQFNQVVSGSTPGFGAANGHSLAADGVNPAFGSFGTLNLTDVLALKGFEYKTFNDNGSNVTHANLFYRIYPLGSPSGAFSSIQATSPVSTSGNDKTWQVTNGSTNLLSGLSNGDYTLEIYTESYTNGVNTSGNIFGFSSNPTATFTVVPEPASSAFGLIGAVLLLRRRR